MNKNICGNCNYLGPNSKHSGEQPKHECHLNPPTVLIDNDGIYHRYPAVEYDALACRFFAKDMAKHEWPAVNTNPFGPKGGV